MKQKRKIIHFHGLNTGEIPPHCAFKRSGPILGWIKLGVNQFKGRSCSSPDGSFRPWNMSWRSELEICHPRTSTSSPPATSSSCCWTCCSLNTLAGTQTSPHVTPFASSLRLFFYLLCSNYIVISLFCLDLIISSFHNPISSWGLLNFYLF